MTDLQYRNRSISSLVEELNSLGNRQVLVHNTKLIALQKGENKEIKRFQSRSLPQKQFFKLQQSDKKYFYDEIASHFNSDVLKEFIQNWNKGHNCTFVLENNSESLTQIMKELQKYTKDVLTFAFIVNKKNQIVDLLSQATIIHRELLQNKKYYQIQDYVPSKIVLRYIQQHLDSNYHTKQQKAQTFINITFKSPESFAEINVLILPSQFFNSECEPPFSLIKTQILQLLNYIKVNPHKRYEHISKLITKRLPLTNFLTKILMNDSCNCVLNWIDSSQKNQGKFQFFDKLAIVSNLFRKADRQVLQIGVKKLLSPQQRKSEENERKSLQNPLKLTRTRQNVVYSPKEVISISPITKLTENQEPRLSKVKDIHGKKSQNNLMLKEEKRNLQRKEFDFCRSLERKTHKYSLSPYQQQNEQIPEGRNTCKSTSFEQFEQKNKKTLSKYKADFGQQRKREQMEQQQFIAKTEQGRNIHQLTQNENQIIALLKAQHARQVSQYHQTIQLLNKKIMVLTKQLNLEELYKIHERQIMLLQLKIQQLRDDVVSLTKTEPDQKACKSIIKRLTQEVKMQQTSSTAKKISQGKINMIEKQLRQTKQKLNESQKNRSKLLIEIDALTKRLKIRDSELEKVNLDDLGKFKTQQLSLTEEELLQDMKKLIYAVKNQQRNSSQYLMRKISLLLTDLSKSRDIILECNDFLVQLMEIIDQKLNNKFPEVVLDCNKFIRTFLMDNLSIF